MHVLVSFINTVSLVQVSELMHVLPIFVTTESEFVLAQWSTQVPFSIDSTCSGHFSIQVLLNLTNAKGHPAMHVLLNFNTKERGFRQSDKHLTCNALEVLDNGICINFHG